MQDRSRLKGEQASIKRQFEGLFDATAESTRSPGLQDKLSAMEGRLAAIKADLASSATPPVRLKPNLSELLRHKVAELAVTLVDPSIAQPARGLVRGPIDKVSVRCEAGQVIVALDGAQTALIGLAQNAKSTAAAGLGRIGISSVKAVAGTRNRLKSRSRQIWRGSLCSNRRRTVARSLRARAELAPCCILPSYERIAPSTRAIKLLGLVRLSGAVHVPAMTDLSQMAVVGATFAVRVTPNARRASVDLVDGVIRISVTVVPEAGRATEAARASLAKALGVAKTRLILVRGATARDKLFRLD